MQKDQDFSRLSMDERSVLIEKIYVPYPRQAQVLDRIKYCHQHSKISAEPECLFIKGPSGIGKTTILRKYLEASPRRVEESRIVVPVLSAIIPVPATVMNLVSTLLRSMGDPKWDQGTIYKKTGRLYDYIKKCGVELIILDEFQHFIDRDSQKILKTVSDWLKNMLNEVQVPIVLIGLPNSDQILDANEQLYRRFAEKIEFSPFGWRTAEQQAEFRKLLLAIDRLLPLNTFSNLADVEMAFRFYCASGGIINNVIKIIRRAARLALERSEEQLTLDLLAQAYDEKFRDRHAINPFKVSLSDLDKAVSPPTPPEPLGASRRTCAKPRKEKISDILTANG